MYEGIVSTSIIPRKVCETQNNLGWVRLTQVLPVYQPDSCALVVS